MYVERRSINDIPKGATVLTDDEVLSYYNNYIFATSRGKEVWFLKHGFIIAGCTAFVTNFSLVDYYRRRCKLHGFISAILINFSLVALPSAFALLYHYTECRQRILLANLCTSCLYGRAAVIQNVFSIGYGICPSAFGLLLYAGLRGSYPVPGMGDIDNIKGTFNIWKKFTKRRIPAICAFFVANTAIITYITKKQLEEKDRLDYTLKEQREKLKGVVAQYKQKE